MQALVPRLRFPEFRDVGEWEQKSIGEVCTVLQGYGFPTAMQGKEDGKYPFCKVSDISRAVAEQGGLLAGAANYVDDVDVSKLRAKLIPKGATAFAKIGEALRLNRRAFVHRKCLIDNNAVALKAIEGAAIDYFIYLLTQLIDLNQHCGGAVPSVNKSTLEAIAVVLPKPEEQQKIADCLSSLDTLIAAQAEKIDALKTHKKGLMQQLFPREGETIPRLRLPEFREDWASSLMSELYSFKGNNSLSRDKLNYCGGAVRNIHYGDIHTKFALRFRVDAEPVPYINDDESHSAIRPENYCVAGDMVFADASEDMDDIGKAVEIIDAGDLPLVSGLHTILAKPKKPRFVVGFGAYLFSCETVRKQIQREAQGAKVLGLSAKRLGNVRLLYPVKKAEQKEIAGCLSSCDALIAEQVERLDALKLHKTGLMQQLFPGIEGMVL